MKILGINSQVKFAGGVHTVTGVQSNGLTLINDSTDKVVTMSLEQVNQQINEKTLRIVKV